MTKIDAPYEPNLLRHIFPTYRVPRVSFAKEGIPLSVPQAVLRVDSTFALGALALRLRLYDSLGLGLPWSEAPIPRSVPRLMRMVAYHLGLQPDQLEFVGSNDPGLGRV